MAVFSNLLSKRIPTLLGLLLLIAGLGTGLFLVGRATLIPRAAAEETPKEIKITNISENSFSVSWITDQVTVGFVRYGTAAGSLDQTVSDDRDQLSGSVGSYLTHHVTMTRLRPETTYYFKLGSGAQRVLFDNGGQAYSVQTPAVLGTPPPADTVYGTIQTSQGGPASGALVYVTLPNSTPLSALAKAEGNWAVSLSTARTRDLAQYVDYDRQATLVELFVQDGQGQTATAVTTTANDAPVPPITMGQTLDFRGSSGGGDQEETSVPPGAELDGDTSETAEATLEQSKFSLQSLGPAQEASSSYELGIVNPEAEGEQVATTRPEIFGTSPKNVTLTITVESPTPYTDTIEVGNDGFWQWSPPADLTAGEHTVTVSYTDENGILQRLSRSFVVLAAEGNSSLPAFEATPSATASPSPSPAPTATDSARVSQPSTASGVPVAGNLTPTLALFILGLGLFGAGVFWQLRLKV